MIKSFLFSACILLVAVSAHAQDSLKYSTLSFGSRVNSIWSKDKFQYPYTYKGNNIALNAAYSRFGPKGYHTTELTFSSGKLHSNFLPTANNTMVQLKYNYLRSLNRKHSTSRLTTSLGGGVHIFYNSTNYLPSIESPINYLTTGTFITLDGAIKYRLSSRSTLTLQASLPVFGVLYRPDFEVNGNTLLGVALPGKGAISAKLEYAYQINSKVSVTAKYEYNYFNYDKPRPVSILQSGLSIGLRIKLVGR